MKRTQGSPLGSQNSKNISNGPMAKTTKPPCLPVISSKPPLPHDNKPSIGAKPTKPPPAPKTARISDLMKQFEKSPGPEQTSRSQSPSPQHEVVSPVHNLGAPKRVDPDVSPLSGRRFNKKESLGDLKKRFEDTSSDRSISPSSREGSRGTSPDGGKPFLPPRPGGGSSNPSAPSWAKNRIPEERTPPMSSRSSGGRPPPHDQPLRPPAVVESSPGPSRPLPSWKKEPPAKPPAVEQELPPRRSPNVGRRLPPPVSPAPPEPPPAESEDIEEEDSSDAKQSFVYRYVR